MRRQEQIVHDHHHLVLHDIGRILLDEFLMPPPAEVRHEPQHVAPPAAVARRMRIAFLVAEVMVLAMVGDPSERRAFARQPAEERQQPAHRPIGFEAAMRQAAMVTHAHAARAGTRSTPRKPARLAN